MADKIDKASVQGWLDGLGLSYEDLDLQEEVPYEWALTVSGQAFTTLVALRQADYNHLFLQVSLRVSPEHTEVLEGLDDATRMMFVHDLKLELLRQPVGHVLVDPGEEGIISEITFGYNLFEEPIQRAGFFRRNHQLQTAGHVAATMFQKLALKRGWS